MCQVIKQLELQMFRMRVAGLKKLLFYMIRNTSPTAVFYLCSVRHFLVSLLGGIYWPEANVLELLLVTAGGILPVVTNAPLLTGSAFPKERLVTGYKCHWLWMFAWVAERTQKNYVNCP